MKAAVRVEPKHIEIVEMPMPTIGPGQSLVKVDTISLCGGDLHYFNGPMPFSGVVPGVVDAPYVVCHEVTGEVVEMDGSGPCRVGDSVVVDPQHRCGVCRACRNGDVELCPERKDMGYSAPGGAAEYIVVPNYRLHRVPPGIDPKSASATHGLAATLHALHAVELAGVRRALVTGPGPAGVMFAMSLLAKLPHRQVLVAGRPSPRLEIVARIGAQPVDMSVTPLANFAFDWDQDNGFDLIVETTGSVDVIESSLACLAPKGSLLLYAPNSFTLDGNMVFRRELRILGSTGATGGMDEALAMIADGRAPLDQILTHSFDLASIQRAFELVLAPPAARGGLLKATVSVA